MTPHFYCCRNSLCTAKGWPRFSNEAAYLSPFSPATEDIEGRRKGESIAHKLSIYLPVSSFEHHSKGTMSNQVFPAVLKISHSLHCEDVMVQLVLGTGEQPYTLLSSSETKPGANDPLSLVNCAFCTAGLFHDGMLWCALLHKRSDAVRTWSIHVSFVRLGC